MRIEINEPQAIWEVGQQTEQQDFIYPRKGEADQADRIFIVSNGHSSDGKTSQDIIKNISGYFKRYRTANGDISDDDIRAAIDTCRNADGNSWPTGISFVMICLHHEGMTIVSVGNCHIYQIRPSAKRMVYENKGSEKATFANPAIYHTEDIEEGDYFYLCTSGMLEQSDSAAVLKFFCEEGSNDKKRNILRSSTASNKANHAAYFFNVRSIISDDGKELTGRRNIVIPEIKSAHPIGKAYDDEDDDDEEVVKPLATEETAKKPEAPKPQPKPQPQQRQRQQTKHQARPISQYEDERHQTNVRMVVLVAVIVILAIAAGMLWYFNSSTKQAAPADTTTVEPAVKDTTATTTAEPADSAIIPDSAIAEPDRDVQPVAPKKRSVEPEYQSTETEPAEEEPATEPETTEPEHKAEPEPAKPATETPKTAPATTGAATTE